MTQIQNRIQKQLFVLAMLFSCSAQAGFIEVGANGSYRKSNITVDTTDESRSLSGSLSYYFNEASAIEFSYTEGTNKRDIAKDSPNAHITHLFYSSVGLDLVYTFGERNSPFRPYVKSGASYVLRKRIVDQQKVGGVWDIPSIVEQEPALVPTAGIGFKLGLTERLSLKVGVDAWTSQPVNRDPLLIDYAARLGTSWLF